MNEATLNTIIKNSLTFGHKISDNGIHGKLPCDGFGMYGSKPFYWEAKILPKPMAFNFNRLEDHQMEALSTIKRLGGDAVITAFIICVDYGRGDKRVFIYTDMEEIAKRKELHLSIKKKEFDSNTSYVKIKNALIDLSVLI
jgi:penicillin-binding protein-related factor A (putative recombinase)